MHVYAIEKAELKSHKPDILAIMGRNLENSIDENFAWKYEESPHGTANCWLIKDHTIKKYVGSAAVFPRKIYINGKPIDAFVAGDFSVDIGHRSFGPALKLQREILAYVNENERSSLIYGLPNRLSEPIFQRAGYRPIGHYGRYVKLLRAEYIASKTRPFWGKFIKIINPALKYLSHDFYYRRPNGVSVEIIEKFDRRFDYLFNDIISQHTIISDRGSEYLNWRYIESSLQKHYIFSILYNNELCGYVVYYTKDNSCYIKDMICNKTNGMLDGLFAEFIQYIRSKNIETINLYYFGSNKYKNMLKTHGFHLRKHEADKIFVYLKNKDMEKYIFQQGNWHFLAGDND